MINVLHILIGTTAEVIFQCDTEHCLNQQVEYQCTVTGSDLQLWRIRNNLQNGVQESTVEIRSSSTTTVPLGAFTFKQLSQSPIISNISFTVQSNLDQDVISCEDQQGSSETCIINILGRDDTCICSYNNFCTEHIINNTDNCKLIFNLLHTQVIHHLLIISVFQ